MRAEGYTEGRAVDDFNVGFGLAKFNKVGFEVIIIDRRSIDENELFHHFSIDTELKNLHDVITRDSCQ